jgi:hypothetical protein
VILRLVLALGGLLAPKVAALALADGVVTDEFVTALTLFDAAALFVAPAWVAMRGSNRATGPLRTFALVPGLQLFLIGSNVVLQTFSFAPQAGVAAAATTRVGGEALTRSVLGGLPGGLALWLLATTFAFAFVCYRMRFVPTQSDRRRAAAFVAAHYTARLGRDPLSVAEARPESVVRAKDALAAAAAAAAGLSALGEPPDEGAGPEPASAPVAESAPATPAVAGAVSGAARAA